LQLKYPNIVKCFGILESPFKLVLEWVEKRSLEDLLRDKHNNSPKDSLPSGSVLQHIVFNIVDALAYLHLHEIVHGDVRACNFLVDQNNQIKISDFGLAKKKAGSVTIEYATANVQGDLRWLAPEYFKIPRSTMATDIYSFGMVIYEILTGNIPYQWLSYDQLFQTIPNGTAYEDHKKFLPQDSQKKKFYEDIFSECVSKEQRSRPSMTQIKKKFFGAIENKEKLKAIFAKASKKKIGTRKDRKRS